jgi:hypothetical protein
VAVPRGTPAAWWSGCAAGGGRLVRGGRQHRDGDPAGAVPMTFTVTPGAIAVLAREGASAFGPTSG